jgi:zinc transporter ZupT
VLEAAVGAVRELVARPRLPPGDLAPARAPSLIAFVLAFAGGAILTMLADTMMPEAFEHGGKLVGVFTTLGFATAFAVSAFE